MAGFDDPRQSHGANNLDLPFRHLLASYKTQDPAAKPQVALPVSVVEYAGAYYQAPRAATRAAADLTTAAFFYLLQVGEYTMPKPNVRTQTVQFRVQDVTFRRASGTIIPRASLLEQLLQAVSAILWLDNQKNGQSGATIYHEACHLSWFCPGKALARKVAGILLFGVDDTTPAELCATGRPCPSQRYHQSWQVCCPWHQPRGPRLQFGAHWHPFPLRLGSHGAQATRRQQRDQYEDRLVDWSYFLHLHPRPNQRFERRCVAQRMATRIHFVNVGGDH